jgi:carbon-monoxide dehydrogenase medium subunit
MAYENKECKSPVRSQKSEVRSQIEDVAISVGPVSPVLFRAAHTEEFLRGKVLDDATLDEATRVLLDEAQPRTSAHRASREYRVELLPTMLYEVLTRAVERAQIAK